MAMTKVDELRRHLKRGKVYRRSDLEVYSTAVDRHLGMLVKEGALQKIAPGMYYHPRETVYGAVPPDEETLVKSFLKDDRFLVTSPNVYNSLGVGTTQLYNKRVVYNHKRHGEYTLGNKHFTFLKKPHFPKQVTPEFLVVDLVNNVDTLAEDKTMVLGKVADKVRQMDHKKLAKAVREYGSVRTRKLFDNGRWLSA
ncbi:DUF6088 family protein [Mucilaginibacter sp.]|uniref:DUF6088 family protein n=1 Tax=Mucilaginibacter sp. TaxID=1882438 RepID=UPI002621D828|nr:DUF6088 family protein [Mucilaginibacter sp.]MDB4921809.1 hypothetical protein [Mucilaginibacter sp.]